jgi:hypothetical protein
VTRVFSKISRYRKLPDVVTVDAVGRALASKSLRLLPRIEGRFLHTVEEGDRLDNLAFKYYDQPRDWWRIMDANPAFLSPDALLGTDSVVRVLVPVTWHGRWPPWSELLRALRRTPGIETALLGTTDRPYPDVDVALGPLLFGIAPALVDALRTSARAQALEDDLAAALLAEGLDFSGEIRIAELDAATWRVTDLPDHRVCTFRHFPADPALNVHESVPRHDWVIAASYNGLTRTAQEISAIVEAHGFAAEPAAEIRRIGKPVLVPPRRI